jgi:hypothetical protein
LGLIAAALIAKALDRTEDAVVDAGDSAIKRLFGLIRSRLTNGPDLPSGTTLARLEEAPDSPSRVRALAEAIDELAARDEGFKAELQGAIDEADRAGLQINQLTQSALGDANIQIAGVKDSTISVKHTSQG